MNNDLKRVLQIGTLSIFFILIVVYALWRSEYLILGVKITNVNLADGTKVSEGIIEITGNARNATNLILNGREISIDENGNFNETIALLPGYNIISLRAEDKFGYTDEHNYKLIYQKDI